MSDLNSKSLSDLRVMAQAFGVHDIFEKDAAHLIQEIEIKQQKLYVTPTVTLPPMPAYDARLMTRAPSRRSEPMEVTDLLAPYIQMGLRLRIENERWFMGYDKRTDEGTLRMPLRNIRMCADYVMTGKR